MALSICEQPPLIPLAALAELKAALGINNAEDDALLYAHLRSAYGLCEAFTGRALLHSRRRLRLAVRTGVQRLPETPVIAIQSVSIDNMAADAPEQLLPITRYHIDISGDGHGEVALLAPLPAQPLSVRYSVGSAAEWNDLPAPLRQGIIRLAGHQHLHGHAQGSADASPPLVVAALWRPWRQMRLA